MTALLADLWGNPAGGASLPDGFKGAARTVDEVLALLTTDGDVAVLSSKSGASAPIAGIWERHGAIKCCDRLHLSRCDGTEFTTGDSSKNIEIVSGSIAGWTGGLQAAALWSVWHCLGTHTGRSLSAQARGGWTADTAADTQAMIAAGYDPSADRVLGGGYTRDTFDKNAILSGSKASLTVTPASALASGAWTGGAVGIFQAIRNNALDVGAFMAFCSAITTNQGPATQFVSAGTTNRLSAANAIKFALFVDDASGSGGDSEAVIDTIAWGNLA